jgi:uncharacterized membrane protein YebE (DUF533 family)
LSVFNRCRYGNDLREAKRMFNAEKVLGGMLLRGSRRRGGIGGILSGGGVALGLIGVAMAAVEQYMDKSQAGDRPAPPPPPPLAADSTDLAPPPAPAEAPPGPGKVHPEALLLIRAMIAAANADGKIDQQERDRIISRLRSVQLTGEEHAFVVAELGAPKDLDGIVEQVTSGDLARQVYAVSLLAIEVDTEAEKAYMDTLAGRLGLDKAAVDEIRGQLGVERG